MGDILPKLIKEGNPQLSHDATVRLEELLPKVIKRGGDKIRRLHDETSELSDLGITKTQSARYQLLAQITIDLFENEILRIKSAFIEPTTKAILELYKDQIRAGNPQLSHDVIIGLEELDLTTSPFGWE